MNFRVANSHLRYSSSYKECQSYLLSKENREKESTVRNIEKKFSSLKISLQNELNLVEFFVHVNNFFGGNQLQNFEIEKFSSARKIDGNKLVHGNKTENYPKKFIFNFFKYELSHAEKKLLAKRLCSCIAPK